jgi:putative phosphoesterase
MGRILGNDLTPRLGNLTGKLILSIVFSRKLLIGLISDTHIAVPDKTLPPQIKEAFRGVDLILHAGDIWISSALDELESIAPVIAAWGDDDMEVDLGEDKRMLSGHALHFDGVTLWLAHIKPRYGLISPQDDWYSSWPKNEEPKDPPQVVVYGHTHFAKIEDYKGVLLVNPGSATLPNYVPKPGTVALLNISSGRAEARILPLE